MLVVPRLKNINLFRGDWTICILYTVQPVENYIFPLGSSTLWEPTADFPQQHIPSGPSPAPWHTHLFYTYTVGWSDFEKKKIVYTFHVVPNFNGNPIPKFHLFKLSKGPQKMLTDTLTLPKTFFSCFLKPVTGVNIIIFYRTKNEEKYRKKLVLTCSDQKQFCPLQGHKIFFLIFNLFNSFWALFI